VAIDNDTPIGNLTRIVDSVIGRNSLIGNFMFFKEVTSGTIVLFKMDVL